MATDLRDRSLRDRVVLLLISGMSTGAAETFCLQQGADPDAAKAIVGEARKRITLTADYARDEQLGRAIMRLEDLYAKSIAATDTRTALQAQRELNRLLRLHEPSEPATPAADPQELAEARRLLDSVRNYLLDLNLAPADVPIDEHARVAAELLIDHDLCDVVPAPEGKGKGQVGGHRRRRPGHRRHSTGTEPPSPAGC